MAAPHFVFIYAHISDVDRRLDNLAKDGLLGLLFRVKVTTDKC